MTTPTQGEHAQTALAHELFAAAQLAPGEGIEDAVSRIAAALAAAPVVQAEQLHITHGPLMRHAAALLRSRKPVLPDHESVAAELELAVEGRPTPSGEPSAEWLEVMRIATTPAQPAPQGVAYAEPSEFPAGAIVNGRTHIDRLESFYSFDCEAGPLINCDDWHGLKRCFEHLAERASNGQAPAGATLFDEQGFRDWVLRNLPDDTIIGNGAWWAEHLTAWAKRFIKATPAAQADSVPAITKRAPILAYPPLPDLVSSVWPFIHTNAAADSAAMVAKTSDQVDDAIHTLLRAYVDADRAARKQGGKHD